MTQPDGYAPGGPSEGSRGTRCPICEEPSDPIGAVHGRYSMRDYHMRRCPACHFAFIEDPWLEFDRIYDEAYYEGRGADPMVDYQFELQCPDRTIRVYEWKGIGDIVDEFIGRPTGQRWLDFGCGNGGLVRYLNTNTSVDAYGYDSSKIIAEARRRGIPILSDEQLRAQEGSFDVVTAIEVIEHTVDPLSMLRQIRRLLRPGGLFFLTTGNARPFADRLTRWSYVVPELHMSFFEPLTLEVAMHKTGFRSERKPRGPAFDQMLKYLVLRKLRMRRRNQLTDMLPSSLLGSIVERMRHLGEQPVGWAE